MGISYKDAGVDIELGDDASKVLFQAAKLTWENRKGEIGEVISPFDDFSGVRVVDVSELPKGSLMCLGFDGVGTKMEIGERIGKHDTIAYDLFAMVCDDAVVRGGEPVLIGSILDVNCLSKNGVEFKNFLKDLAVGYVAAAKEANVAVINGELAELGSRVSGYGDFNYNWGAGLVWFARKDRMFTGHEIKEGDKVIALSESGFRSNGLSLARKILSNAYGNEWHKKEDLAEKILEPSKIYSKFICELTGGFSKEPKTEIHGVVHVTGGGVPGKLGRILRPSGLGADLPNLFAPCDLMLEMQKMGEVSDKEAYQTWNMGQGMLIIAPEDKKIKEIAEKYKFKVKVCGTIVKESGIKIKSQGGETPESILNF